MTPQNFFADPAAYDAAYSPDVLSAAITVAAPYLVQQGNVSLPGVTVSGNTVSCNGESFTINNVYLNPASGYFAPSPPAFETVWPGQQFPNSLYDADTQTFNGTIDCVGFGCRVLISTGNPGDTSTNAYLELYRQIKAAGASHFPGAPNIVPSAYEFAVALPTLAAGGAWSYVAGNVNAQAIQNDATNPQPAYNGVSKSGFSAAQSGDILCFGYIGPGSNGHFMVLTAPPQPVAMNTLAVTFPPFVATVYNIGVYDSTDFGGSLHVVDSRRNGNPQSSGIGYGELFILANAADEPVGFIFGLNPEGGLQEPHYLWGLTPQPQNPTGAVSQIVALTVGRFQ